MPKGPRGQKRPPIIFLTVAVIILGIGSVHLAGYAPLFVTVTCLGALALGFLLGRPGTLLARWMSKRVGASIAGGRLGWRQIC